MISLLDKNMCEIYNAPLSCENFCGHHNDPSFSDRSSSVLMQYLNYFEDRQNSQNLMVRRIFPCKGLSRIFLQFLVLTLQPGVLHNPLEGYATHPVKLIFSLTQVFRTIII